MSKLFQKSIHIRVSERCVRNEPKEPEKGNLEGKVEIISTNQINVII